MWSPTANRRRPIAVLAPALAQRIAAGEVVERPASVMRELVENALDAGARAITIEIRGAGLELIAVSDDGHGIAATELRMAFARHGTSKIATSDDLEAIATLGFRGEALPSIAAVAVVEVSTATGDDLIGARLLIRDGEVLEEGHVARTTGTTIRVRELFASAPVRRGFLPAARAEAALLLSLVRRYALAWPEVRFSMHMEGKEVFRTAGLGEASALAAVFGSSARRLAPFGPLAVGAVRFSGRLGDPGLTRADREGLVVIVNGRWVTPVRWHAALEAGYSPLLRRGRHPVVVLRATVEPHLVDVNRHPAKLEVRLRDEDEILAALAAGIRDALGRTPPEALLLPSSVGQPRQRKLPSARRLLGEEPADYDAERPDYARLRVLGQLLNTMIVAEDRGALYLIDQHRADERALYERLSAEHLHGGSQELLEPLSLELRAEQETGMEMAISELTRLGFRCEQFGRRLFLVRAVPAGLPASAGAALVEALGGESLQGENWRDRVLTSVACRSAIKRGQLLEIEEMQRLLSGLAACSVQSLCPHGSPIVARVRAGDLARHFEWR